MVTIALREFLKRRRLLVNLVHSARELWYKSGGGVRTNFQIVNELAAFSPSFCRLTQGARRFGPPIGAADVVEKFP